MAADATSAPEVIRSYLAGAKAVIDALSVEQVEGLIDRLCKAYEEGRTVFVAGNGGSAATASHIACDLSKTVLGSGMRRRAKRFRLVALTDNVPVITAWANDVGYETVFAEQMRNLASRGDLLLVITGSGNSPNIVEAVRVAGELGLESFGLLGFDGGVVKGMLDGFVMIRSENYGHVEDAHMMLGHLITEYFKGRLSDGIG